MGRIVTFGEIMLRLSSEGYDRLFQNDWRKAVFGSEDSSRMVELDEGAGFCRIER